MERDTAREDLAAIRSLMAESQSFLSGTWSHQLVWGSLASIGLVATWLAVRAESWSLIGGVWAAVLLAGWGWSLVGARRRTGRSRVRNVASRAFGAIWMGLGVTLTLLGTVTVVTGSVDPLVLPGLIALVFGAGYFASGALAEMRWLSGVGVVWWIGGVALLLWRSPDAMLALAAMALFFEVGPALVLKGAERDGATTVE